MCFILMVAILRFRYAPLWRRQFLSCAETLKVINDLPFFPIFEHIRYNENITDCTKARMDGLEPQWFYAKADTTYGPFSAGQMQALAAEGSIEALTRVMAQGMTDWITFEDSELYTAHDHSDANNHKGSGFFGSAASRIHDMTGEEGPVTLKFSTFFSDVFKRHSKREGERIFIAGTAYTTPALEKVSSSWPRPWLFSRVFVISLFVYAMLYLCALLFGNPYALEGLILIGAFAVPVALIVFFFEANVPRNISIFSVIELFFVGGVAAIVVTLFLYQFVTINHLSAITAIIIGIIEESGKLIIAALFIRQMRVSYILNGLLIGAVIGAGFAAFESAGYALTYLMSAPALFQHIIFTRAWSSVGSHAIWTAISAAGLLIAKKDRPFSAALFRDTHFLQFFAVAIALHAVWDMPIMASDFKYIILIGIGWFFVFVIINSGLRQLTRIIRQKAGLR